MRVKKRAFYENKLRLESNNNIKKFFSLSNELTCAAKDNDKEKENINVDECNDFFCKSWREKARKFTTLKELGVRKRINSTFLVDIMQSEISSEIMLKIKFSLNTYGLNNY